MQPPPPPPLPPPPPPPAARRVTSGEGAGLGLICMSPVPPHAWSLLLSVLQRPSPSQGTAQEELRRFASRRGLCCPRDAGEPPTLATEEYNAEQRVKSAPTPSLLAGPPQCGSFATVRQSRSQLSVGLSSPGVPAHQGCLQGDFPREVFHFKVDRGQQDECFDIAHLGAEIKIKAT